MDISVKNDCLYYLSAKDVSKFYEYLLREIKMKKHTRILVFFADETPDAVSKSMVSITIKFTIDGILNYKYICYRAKGWACSNIRINQIP